MTKNMTADGRAAKRLKDDITSLPTILGDAAERAAFERSVRMRPTGGNMPDAEARDAPEEKKLLDRLVMRALYSTVAAASDPFKEPGSYTVRPSKQNPVAVKNKNGDIQYIGDGLSYKNSFNTTAAVPVPGAPNTFKLQGPKARSEMSFAEAVSTPASTYYAQVGPQSAIPSGSGLADMFAVHTKPQTFADALQTSNPISVPGIAPVTPAAKLPDIKLAPRKDRIVEMSGPMLSLDLN